MSAEAVLRRETIRVEPLRVWEILRVPVGCVRHHHGVAPGWQHVAVAQVGFLLDFPEQKWDRREETQRLLDHLQRHVELSTVTE